MLNRDELKGFWIIYSHFCNTFGVPNICSKVKKAKGQNPYGKKGENLPSSSWGEWLKSKVNQIQSKPEEKSQCEPTMNYKKNTNFMHSKLWRYKMSWKTATAIFKLHRGKWQGKKIPYLKSGRSNINLGNG